MSEAFTGTLTTFQFSALKCVRTNQPYKPVSDKSNAYKFLRNRGLTTETEEGYVITEAGEAAIAQRESLKENA